MHVLGFSFFDPPSFGPAFSLFTLFWPVCLHFFSGFKTMNAKKNCELISYSQWAGNRSNSLDPFFASTGPKVTRHVGTCATSLRNNVVKSFAKSLPHDGSEQFDPMIWDSNSANAAVNKNCQATFRCFFGSICFPFVVFSLAVFKWWKSKVFAIQEFLFALVAVPKCSLARKERKHEHLDPGTSMMDPTFHQRYVTKFPAHTRRNIYSWRPKRWMENFACNGLRGGWFSWRNSSNATNFKSCVRKTEP